MLRAEAVRIELFTGLSERQFRKLVKALLTTGSYASHTRADHVLPQQRVSESAGQRTECC